MQGTFLPWLKTTNRDVKPIHFAIVYTCPNKGLIPSLYILPNFIWRDNKTYYLSDLFLKKISLQQSPWHKKKKKKIKKTDEDEEVRNSSLLEKGGMYLYINIVSFKS